MTYFISHNDLKTNLVKNECDKMMEIYFELISVMQQYYIDSTDISVIAD